MKKFLFVCLFVCFCLFASCSVSDSSPNESSEDNLSYEVDSRKIVYVYSSDIYCDDIEKSIENLEKMIFDFEGAYFENYEKNFNSDIKQASYVLRVKSEDLTSFTKKLKELGEVNNERQTAKDITKEYFDIQAALDSKLAEEKRLLELYEKADYSQIYTISQSIQKVQNEINSLKSTLQNYDLLVNYSSVTITLYDQEAKETLNFGQKLGNVLKGTGLGVLVFLEYLLYTIIVLTPFGILGFIIFFITKKIKKIKETKNNVGNN